MIEQTMIIGDRREAGTDTMTVTSPYDGNTVGTVPVGTPRDIDAAVSVAQDRLREPLPAWRRAEILDAASRGLADPDKSESFATLIAREAAKPIRAARVEVERTVQTFAFAAAEARTLAGEVLPLDAHPAGTGRIGFTLRVPIGVVGAITPFNFPLNLVAHKVAPAIAAGCPVVLKPAPQTPLSALALADLLIDHCGLPAGWLSVVTGPGPEAGEALVAHEDVAMISFTGSPGVGWAIRQAAPRKRVVLELGNNSPVIIEPDGDWAEAARAIASAGFGFAGQSCISVQRIIVHEDVADDFEKSLRNHVEALRVGDPLDEDTDVSALIDHGARDRVVSWVKQAVEAGARLVVGGEVVDGILQPTVLADVTRDMRVSQDEIFGPVVGIQRYASLDDAIVRANDTRFGLHAGIYTGSVATALQAARELDFGGVLVNDVPTWRADQMPYGGIRDSGNSREGPAYAVREMTEIRSVVLRP